MVCRLPFFKLHFEDIEYSFLGKEYIVSTIGKKSSFLEEKKISLSSDLISNSSECGPVKHMASLISMTIILST